MVMKDDISKDGGAENITAVSDIKLGHGSEIDPTRMNDMSFTNAYQN